MTSRNRRGATLIEVTVSTALVGLVIVGAIETMRGSLTMARRGADESKRYSLAESLLSEALAMPFEDPVNPSGAIGADPGEDASPTDRSGFDDVDDYDGWSSSPPQAPDGTDLADYDGWTREVVVERVAAEPDADDELRSQSSDDGLVQLTVRIEDPEGVVTELVALRSRVGATEHAPPLGGTRVIGVGVEIAAGSDTTVSSAVALVNETLEP